MKYKIITDEQKKKISKTKSETGRQKIIEGSKLCESKQTKHDLKIATHRKHKYISLEEYKNLIKQGKTTLEVCEMTSKHLVYFYNALLKGRINLSKEDFEENYNNGLSLDEISKKFNIPREHITQLRDFYGIKRKGATFQKRLKNEQPLSQEAKDVIIGSLLGDGHITKWGYFSEKHSPAQLEYLRWKASFFPNITTNTSWSYYESIDKRSGSVIKTHSFRTTTHSWIQEMEKLWYKTVDGKRIKVIPEKIREWMNTKILAIWFMDDGSTDWMYRNGKKITTGSNPMCKLCTESFSENDHDLLINSISDLGLTAYIYYKDKDPNKPNIKFSTQESLKLMNTIREFMLDELIYKVDENVYLGTT